jgi:hypothetical protein
MYEDANGLVYYGKAALLYYISFIKTVNLKERFLDVSFIKKAVIANKEPGYAAYKYGFDVKLLTKVKFFI